MSERVLPEGWREVTLRELVAEGVLELGDGYRTKSSELGEGGYRIVRAADISADRVRLESSDFVAEEFAHAIGPKAARAGDVVLTTKGTVGRVAVMPELTEPAVYAPQLCYFRTRDSGGLSSAYLRYWLQSSEFLEQASYMQGNTDMAPYISLSDLRSAGIVLRPLNQQRAIAEVLGALDDKIAANTRLAEASSAVALALASQSSTLVRVSEVAVHTRSQVTPAEMAAEVVHHYSLPAFDAASGPDVVVPGEIKSSKFLVTKPSVLVSKLNPRFPRIWDVPILDGYDALASTEFVVLEPHGISSSLLWALVAQPAVSVELEAQVAGTSGSHQRVKPEAILAARIGDPSALSEVAREGIEGCISRAHAVRRETSKLIATRDALLPALMSGRQTVRDAEAVATGAGL